MSGGNGSGAYESATAGSPASAMWSMPRPSDRPGLEHFDAREGGRELPTLHRMGAMTVQRDRWERLESVIDVPYPRSTVWRALTDPERLAKWFAISVGSLLKTDRDMVLDFEDGEYFLIRPVEVEAPKKLRYYTRWLGIGQVTCVSWQLQDSGVGTRISVVEEATNPPWDWQTWNGGGWPAILEQLNAHLRTGMSWRWPWRRMGPYVQVELQTMVYPAWDQLFSANCLKYWLIARSGEIAAGNKLPIMMGDASGTLEMTIDQVVGPGQEPPSFLPYINYRLERPAWGCKIAGRLWLEPAGWGKCLLQAFHYNWEALPGDLQKSERRILTGYWAETARRAQQVFQFASRAAAPHNW
jgi:uncharacterized protein YndB with AHSA1/START domain